MHAWRTPKIKGIILGRVAFATISGLKGAGLARAARTISCYSDHIAARLVGRFGGSRAAGFLLGFSGAEMRSINGP